ncbi:uncharacterized protein FTOL_00012 [Fusarium torulosum]|uniref:Endonuclease/exonuclease/phosphatase domain-containing protein n=1 Tax=Fusarium torulosum TaxID=33205 RepID=A0AAE8LXM2_9HYPO|nr:uncharacterized protein FTOL_00012 [Fusarium torulosum]
MVPTTEREGRWVIRSMLWVNKEVEAEQVPIDSPDVTAAVVRLPDHLVFTASVYVPGGDAQALQDICAKLRKAIKEVRQRSGRAVDLVIAGDFNRHDQMWGGDDVSVERQGASFAEAQKHGKAETTKLPLTWFWLPKSLQTQTSNARYMAQSTDQIIAR